MSLGLVSAELMSQVFDPRILTYMLELKVLICDTVFGQSVFVCFVFLGGWICDS